MHENNESKFKFKFDTKLSLLRLAMSVMINVRLCASCQPHPPTLYPMYEALNGFIRNTSLTGGIVALSPM